MYNFISISKLFVAAALLLISCGNREEPSAKSISVSIEPISYLVGRITGDDFEINVLVPSGASPELYEPTPAQMRQVANSLLFFNTGLIDFEQNLSRAIENNMKDVAVVSLSQGIRLIGAEHSAEASHNGNVGSLHHHGTDPHIWTTPANLKIMAGKIFNEIDRLYPDSLKYRKNYERLSLALDSLDVRLAKIFENGKNRSFIIYHPALSYLARDYDLNQISIENEGKEPSARHIKELVDRAKRDGIDKVLYQKQFSAGVVRTLAQELGAEVVAVDPLAYNIAESIEQISILIAQ